MFVKKSMKYDIKVRIYYYMLLNFKKCLLLNLCAIIFLHSTYSY